MGGHILTQRLADAYALARDLHDGGTRNGADRVGSHVAAHVMACPDAATEPGAPRPPWLDRKRTFLAKAPRLSPQAALIITCDKIQNHFRDLQRDGLGYPARFSEPDGLIWDFSSLAPSLDEQFQAIVSPPGDLAVSGRVR